MRTIYEHPHYYDILFGWDRGPEADFYEEVLRAQGLDFADPILEVACGTGHVARLLARRGWRVSGVDLSPDMVDYLRRAAVSEGVHVDARVADMARDFASPEEFAAAYNPMSSFRLLHRDAEVEAHLRATAAALRPSGLYVVDLDLLPARDAPAITTDEAWEMARDGVTLRATDDAIHVRDRGAETTLAWGQEGHLRGYTGDAILTRVRASGAFQVVSWHPEAGRNPEGVSTFSLDHSRKAPSPGRTMLVLRRV